MTQAATNTPLSADPVLQTRPENRVWKKFRSHKSAMIGGVLVVFFILIALAAPLLPIPEPAATDWGAVRKAPNWAHWMGTDEIGRDVMSRLIWGAQASLLAGVVSVGIAVLFGVPLGIVAGYFGGWTDAVISRCTEALLAVPLLVGWHLAERKEQIRAVGWVSALPTPVLMVVVDPQEWFDSGRGRLGRKPIRNSNPAIPLPTAAEHLHYRLHGSDLMMSLWLWRSRDMFEREGFTVLDIRSIADVERVTDANVWAYRNGPNWWSPGDFVTYDAESFRDGLTGMIDAMSWLNNGGDVNIADSADRKSVV